MRSGCASRSITLTWTPARASSEAASSPVGPAPMTMTGVCSEDMLLCYVTKFIYTRK
jgi:hypothetical protein